MSTRIEHPAFQKKITTAEEAVGYINHGDIVGFAGFTGSGYPKLTPRALADRAKAAHEKGLPFTIRSWTGASTAPQLDGALTAADAVSYRMPYQSDPDTRNSINAGKIDYVDCHLSHTTRLADSGVIGKVNVAVIEVSAIKADGSLVPSASVGANQTYLNQADKVILEVNEWQTEQLEGMHDIFVPGMPPNTKIIPITRCNDRIGTPYFTVDPDKVVAIVQTNMNDRNTPFKAPDNDSKAIANHIVSFLQHEIKVGRLPKQLPPIQSGVGNIANAVLAALAKSELNELASYTEVIQDGMLDLILSDKLLHASATAFSLSPEYADKLNTSLAAELKGRLLLRPQDISNHPEVIRRLGVISMNGLLELDIYGHINSTHVMGTRVMNGIGGSGDFARNAQIAIFMTPSVAKGGAISCIVPFCSHIDHTEHDTDVVVTEQGLADIRGLAPRKRAQLIIDKCAHPNYQPMLQDYLDRAMKACLGALHTPHVIGEAHAFHKRLLETGTMKL